MKKFLIAVVLILVILLLCLPFIMGVFAKRDIQDRITQINTLMSPAFQLRIEDYHQGWFSSTTELSVNVPSNSATHFFSPQIKISSEGMIREEKKNIVMSYEHKELTVQGKNWGPTSLNLQLRGIGADEWNSIKATLKDVNFNTMSEGQLMITSLQLLPMAIQMVNGASLSIVSKAKAVEGDLKFELELGLGEQKKGPIDPLAVLRNIRGQCIFSIPKTVLKSLLANEAEEAYKMQMRESLPLTGPIIDFSQATRLADEAAEKELAALQQEGWIRVEGNYYVGSYELKDGKILSNGQVMRNLLEYYFN